tara:strand:+ start:162 stop:464 length:303 start_codon:yes stop_codon:yes gene_type:complete
MSKELENAIKAIQQIKSQSDLNMIAEAWKLQQTFIGKQARSGLKKGDTIQWEYRGVVKTGIIQKMNQKTTEVVNVGATPFGRTVTKIYNSMILGKVPEAA